MADPVQEILPPERAAFDALAEGVVWLGPRGQVLDANAAAASILGLSRDQLLGDRPLDPRWMAVHEDGSPWAEHDHPGMVALRTGAAQHRCIVGLIVPDCGRRWISAHVIPQFAAGATQPLGAVASFVDVTGEIDLRRRLREQADELARWYDQAPCSDHMLDLQGRYLRINETGLSWLGVERDALIGRLSPRDFMTEAGRELFDTHFPRLLAGHAVEGLVIELVGAQGRHRWVHVSAHPVFDHQGEVVATRAVQQDITSLQPSREAAERMAAQQRLMLDNDLVGIVRIKDRRILWKNRAFSRIFGYDPGELLGQETAILFPDREAFERFGATSAAALASADRYRTTLELRRKDGSTVWTDTSGTMLDAANGESMWFSKDVTAQRRELELQLKYAELQAENRQQAETARLHSMFLSGLSHELRTPLNAVIGFANLLHTAGPGQDPVRQQRYLQQIEHSGQHLLSMIDNMLELARLESGRMSWQPQAVDLGLLVGEVIGMLEAKASLREISVRCELSADIGAVRLDPLRVRQVLLNYVGNAIKFSKPKGQVTVRASRTPDDRLVIEVQDEGIGISEADQARLFSRFQQLSAGTAKLYEGTGIGLALVKQIVEAQGGCVGVRSAPGQGSVFRAELPLAAPPAADSVLSL